MRRQRIQNSRKGKMTDDEQEKGEKGQVLESHQKFLIKPESLRKVSTAISVRTL